jgi:hypothetical protein
MAYAELAPDTHKSLDEIDQANVETGFRLARSLALQNAALDRRLTPCMRSRYGGALVFHERQDYAGLAWL